MIGGVNLANGDELSAVALSDGHDQRNLVRERDRVDALDPGAGVARKAVALGARNQRSRVVIGDEDVVEVNRRCACRENDLNRDGSGQADLHL